MWAITNRTPYKVGKIWGRGKDGVHEWIIAVKGTFNIRPDGELVLADEQPEPLLLPEYNGEDGRSSLRYDADLIASKPTTDILVNGTAYAPGGRPSTDFMVGLRVGPVYKTLRVKGNRRWSEGSFGGGWSAPEPVTQVPILYERAYGGYDSKDADPRNHRMDSRNPVGCGLASKESPRPGQALPNFEYPDGNAEKAGPAGFGAIDSFWTPRRELQGTYDESWRQGRYPLLPADWNPRSLLCSPADQLPERHLLGGERVELQNLTPGGTLGFVLPKIFLRFSTHIDHRVEEHRGQLGTVIIEPDHPRVIMVWQSSLTVPANGDYLERTIVSEKALIR